MSDGGTTKACRTRSGIARGGPKTASTQSGAVADRLQSFNGGFTNSKHRHATL